MFQDRSGERSHKLWRDDAHVARETGRDRRFASRRAEIIRASCSARCMPFEGMARAGIASLFADSSPACVLPIGENAGDLHVTQFRRLEMASAIAMKFEPRPLSRISEPLHPL